MVQTTNFQGLLKAKRMKMTLVAVGDRFSRFSFILGSVLPPFSALMRTLMHCTAIFTRQVGEN